MAAGSKMLQMKMQLLPAVMQQCKCTHHSQACVLTAAQLKPIITFLVGNSNSAAQIGDNEAWASAKQGKAQQQAGAATAGRSETHLRLPLLVSISLMFLPSATTSKIWFCREWAHGAS
jgi:hypothetical protein